MSDALASHDRLGAPRALWLAAAVTALLLHLGLALLLFGQREPDESDDEMGAPAEAITLDMAAPHTETTDLPPGPEADASDASAAQMQQNATPEQAARPKEEPVESDTADRVVSPDDVKKPEQEKPDPVQAQAAPSAESAASEAAAPPVSEAAREAPVAAAPAIGAGRGDQKLKAAWQKRLVAHLDRSKRYPAGGAQRDAQVIVAFTLDRMGHVVSASVSRSSGQPAFDAAALAMLRRADPVPAPPPLVADDGLSFTVPVVFRTRGRS